jgi:hypothetical protein
MKAILVLFAVLFELYPLVLSAEETDFNGYVLKAVTLVAKDRSGLGYGPGNFTRDLQFGDNGLLPASHPPLTMCVAAQLEILVEALNLYFEDTHDATPFHFLPKVSWQRLRPTDLRGQIWIVENAPSHGAADAFSNFGMGQTVAFKDLRPGSFLNFNRNTGSGHGVVFLGYLDQSGNDLKGYSAAVAGFRYFSAQGKQGVDGSGLGYRWAFFSDAGCPALDGGRKRDCGVIRSESPKLLTGGVVLHPKNWDKKRAAEQLLQSQNVTDPKLLQEGVFDPSYFSGITTDD